MVFLDYSLANIYNILRTRIKTKIPDKVTISEMARESISLAIATYDLEKAIETKAAFRTHLGWKNMQVVTDFARALKKATANDLNTSDSEFADSLEENRLKSDIDGKDDFEIDVDMPEFHRSEKNTIEQMKKIEWAMRQVRFELPRESNMIIDVGIGEIYKEDGEPFTLSEWALYTEQKDELVKKIFRSSKKLLKQKLYRKGFMEIIKDEEKTSEDLLKDTDIEQQINSQVEDENIIESADMETLLSQADELLEDSSVLSDFLKD